MKRVLLLNPPANPPVSRDYYCGHFTKGNYYWPPVDLMVMSGYLSREFDVRVMDAVVEKLDEPGALAGILAFRPDFVIAVTAAVSWSKDMAFLSRVKDRNSVTILVSGDYPRAEPRAVLCSNPFIDAVILDFSENDVCLFLSGGRGPELRNIWSRAHSGEPVIRSSGAFSYPPPHHDLFPLSRYRMPQTLYKPAVPLLTDFGCPFRCDFCYMERIPHKLRSIDNVAEELARLRETGIREIFLADQSFGSHKAHAYEVCEVIDKSGKGSFSWSASMRADSVDPDLLRVMKKSGCHTLMFGVETPAQAVLDKHGKRTTVAAIESAFKMARMTGFRTLAHFIVGLTGDNKDSMERLADFAISLDADIASFNIAAPAWNTSFGDHIRGSGWMIKDGVEVDSPVSLPVWEQPGISRYELLRLRDQAVSRFYLRPSYVIRQLGRVRSVHQLRMLFREGLCMLSSRFKTMCRKTVE